jgi:hypothetical protein
MINPLAAVELRNLFIEKGLKTPQVDLDFLTGDLIFSGKSIPENSNAFYEKILHWVHEYVKRPKNNTNLRLNLEYFNSSSSIWLAKIVKELCSVKKTGYTLMIHLYFDIEDFDTMYRDDLTEALSPIMEMIGQPSISIGIKLYGTDEKGEILKESTVFI